MGRRIAEVPVEILRRTILCSGDAVFEWLQLLLLLLLLINQVVREMVLVTVGRERTGVHRSSGYQVEYCHLTYHRTYCTSYQEPLRYRWGWVR